MKLSGLTRNRLILAVISNFLEEVAIVVLWRWVLPEFGVNIPLPWLIIIMAAWLTFSVSLFVYVTRVLRTQTVVGLPTMVGSKGKAAGRLAPEGQVRIRGELWSAVSVAGEVKQGADVVVVDEEGLVLKVKPAAYEAPKTG